MGGRVRSDGFAVDPKLEKSFSFDHLRPMLASPAIAPITSAQIRAGRGLLKWTQGVLASRASISAVTLNMIESDQVAPRNRTLDSIRSVLEGEGIRFIGDEDGGFGVVLKPRAIPGAEEQDGDDATSPRRAALRPVRSGS